jgi:Flp pilus assembly secretin CpaC
VTSHRSLVWIVAACLAVGASLQAQEKPPSPGPIPLKVQIVVARYRGEKKVSSLPYSMIVNASSGSRASLRLGTNLPIPVTTTPKDGPPLTSFQYRSVGINIDCTGTTLEGGRFKLDIDIEDSSVTEESGPRDLAKTAQAPALGSFKFTDSLILKDGQSSELMAATDKLTGDVTKIEVTLTVIK